MIDYRLIQLFQKFHFYMIFLYVKIFLFFLVLPSCIYSSLYEGLLIPYSSGGWGVGVVVMGSCISAPMMQDLKLDLHPNRASGPMGARGAP